MLPLKSYSFYVGIDPGFSGGLARITAEGEVREVYDMPTATRGKKEYTVIDLEALTTILRGFSRFPSVYVGLENPSTRPGEGAERSFRFGRGIGNIEAVLHVLNLPYGLIPPNLWCGRLGLAGKTDPEAIPQRIALWRASYADCEPFYGPRGGVKDGRLDALLIAHFLRSNPVLTDTVKKHGKGSVEAQMAILGWGGSRRNQRLRVR